MGAKSIRLSCLILDALIIRCLEEGTQWNSVLCKPSKLICPIEISVQNQLEHALIRFQFKWIGHLTAIKSNILYLPLVLFPTPSHQTINKISKNDITHADFIVREYSPALALKYNRGNEFLTFVIRGQAQLYKVVFFSYLHYLILVC